jgi:hypothetical protein
MKTRVSYWWWKRVDNGWPVKINASLEARQRWGQEIRSASRHAEDWAMRLCVSHLDGQLHLRKAVKLTSSFSGRRSLER